MSIKQIAEYCGCSVATVSRVINHLGGYSDETEEKVLAAIKELHYEPNNIARGLRTKQTYTIGVIVSDLGNDVLRNIVKRLQKRLLDDGYLSLICDTDESSQLEQRYLDMLIAQQVAGLICISARDKVKIERPKLPTVYVARHPYGEDAGEYVFVGIDGQHGAYEATRHLMSNGCKHVGCVGLMECPERVAGYQLALLEDGIAPRDDDIEICPISSIGEGYKATKALLERSQSMDGITYGSDLLAMGGINYMQECGISIPQDMQLIGFDNLPIAAKTSPPRLSTIVIDTDAIADQAYDFLMAMIKRQTVSCGDYNIPIHLKTRDTTA